MGLTAGPPSRQAMGMVEMDDPATSATYPSALARESVEGFLRRPGAAVPLLRLILPELVAFDMGELGRLILRPVCLSADSTVAVTGLAETCEVFPLASIEAGSLRVERSFASYLVMAMAHSSAPLVSPPSLSRIERGMLGGFAASVLAKLGLSLGIRVEKGARAAPLAMDLCVRVLARLGAAEGQAWLCANQASLGSVLGMLGRGPGASVVRLELARTGLSEAAAVAAAIGDLVVFEESPALSASSPWAIAICCNERGLTGCLDPDGRVRADDRAARTPCLRGADRSSPPAGVVTITAEIAHRGELSRDSLPSPRGDGVLLRIGEVDWAEGALAEHAGWVAVRITRLLKKVCAG